MNVLVLNGSPHADGNTVQLLQAALQGTGDEIQVIQIDLFSLLPMPCTACGFCQEHDGCMFSDLDDADVLLRQADAFVWALPVYNYSVPAPVKALLDRFQRYYEASEAGKEVFVNNKRPALLLLTAGRKGLYAIDIIKKQIENAGRYVGFELIQTVFAGETDAASPSEKMLDAAFVAGKKLTDALQQKTDEKY